MYMVENYSGFHLIEADDDLTAIRIVQNFDADLYKNNELIFSCNGWTEIEKEKAIEKMGIVWTKKDGYKYKDESKNSNGLFADFYEYQWTNKKCVDVSIHNYRSTKECIEIRSLEEVVKMVKEKYKHLPKENIHVNFYGNNGCESIAI